MAAPRHRANPPSPHKPRLTRLAATALVATTVTAGALTVGLGEATEASSGQDDGSRAISAAADVGSVTLLDRGRTSRVSRSQSRTARRITLTPRVTRHRYATERLNVWTGPGERFRRVGLVQAGTRLGLTGQVRGHWAEVILKRRSVRWVNNDYLAVNQPTPPKPAEEDATGGVPASGVSGAPCPDGSSIEGGLQPNAVRLYRAICAAFPALAVYGGYDPHGEHVDGRAIDFMTYDSGLGNAVAEWARANAGELAIRDIIWAQRIWTPDRAGEGWRYMSDRGSATANHYDHVHIAVF